MTRWAVPFCLAALLAACASSSGVQQTGPDRFTIETSASFGRGGAPAAKRQAYEEAAAACTRRGRQVEVISEQVKGTTFSDGMYRVSVAFRCAE